MSKEVTAEDLEYGLNILARILDTQGDAVWPLFERLERELADMRSRRGRVEKHLGRNIYLQAIANNTDVKKLEIPPTELSCHFQDSNFKE